MRSRADTAASYKGGLAWRALGWSPSMITPPHRQASRGHGDHALALTETASEACGYLCEKPYAQSSYVCALVHYVRAPQLHDALRPRAPPSRDDAQLDDDDERRLSDDAPAPDASVISPSAYF
jgi:hypothetical protein